MTLPAPGSAVPGRGAWTKTGHSTGRGNYQWIMWWFNDGAFPDRDYHHRAVHLGVKAIQGTILLGGYSGTLTATGKFDQNTKNAVVWFQKTRGLTADGIVGPATARKLWHGLVDCMGDIHGVPPEHLWGMMDLESGFDPAAVGVKNGMDSGLCQINLDPVDGHGDEITVEQAFDPVFAIDYTANRLGDARAMFDGKGPELQTVCSIAQHNVPVAAIVWYRDGKPPLGPFTYNNKPYSGYPLIQDYVNKVKARGATF